MSEKQQCFTTALCTVRECAGAGYYCRHTGHCEEYNSYQTFTQFILFAIWLRNRNYCKLTELGGSRGGRSGIRTHEGCDTLRHFQCRALDQAMRSAHSGIWYQKRAASASQCDRVTGRFSTGRFSDDSNRSYARLRTIPRSAAGTNLNMSSKKTSSAVPSSKTPSCSIKPVSQALTAAS